MDLNNPAKIILGVLSFIPPLFAITILGLIVSNFFFMSFSENPEMPLMLFSYLSKLFPYIFFVAILALGLFVFYIVHIIQNSFFDTEKRILWIAIMFFAYGIAIPIYWYVHIWKQRSSKDTETNNLTADHYDPGTQP